MIFTIKLTLLPYKPKKIRASCNRIAKTYKFDNPSDNFAKF